MKKIEEIELLDCPKCNTGTGLLEEENGWCVYVTCCDCGAHTAEVAFKNEEEKDEAIEKAVHLWNIGKVLSSEPGE